MLIIFIPVSIPIHIYTPCVGGVFTCLNPVIMSSFSPTPSMGSQRGVKRSTGQGSAPPPPLTNLCDHQTVGYIRGVNSKLEHSHFIPGGGLSLCIYFSPCQLVRPLLYRYTLLYFCWLYAMQLSRHSPSGVQEVCSPISSDVPLVIWHMRDGFFKKILVNSLILP